MASSRIQRCALTKLVRCRCGRPTPRRSSAPVTRLSYTPNKGAIRIAVKARASGEATIDVQDTGPGIPAAHRTRIFERFYRLDEARSRETGGFGLGLAIARWAVEANGGRIEVDSAEGRGTLFRIVLPLRSH